MIRWIQVMIVLEDLFNTMDKNELFNESDALLNDFTPKETVLSFGRSIYQSTLIIPSIVNPYEFWNEYRSVTILVSFGKSTMKTDYHTNFSEQSLLCNRMNIPLLWIKLVKENRISRIIKKYQSNQTSSNAKRLPSQLSMTSIKEDQMSYPSKKLLAKYRSFAIPKQ